MRTCQSCGRENPPDRDFCQCGEYLRWEPTGFVEAITPRWPRPPPRRRRPPRRPRPRRRRRRGPAAAAAPPPPPGRRAAAAAAPGARRSGHAAAAAAAGRAAAAPGRRAAAPAAASPAAPPEAPRPRRSRCACPTRSAAHGRDARASACTPASRVRVLRADPQPERHRRQLRAARRRAARRVVLRPARTPSTWSPYGTGGTYEQEVEIHLHPPRAPEAEARIWELQVVGALQGARAHRRHRRRCCSASSRSRSTRPRSSPSARPGRRKADFKVAVANKANAPVYVAFDAERARQRLRASVQARRRRDRARRDGRDASMRVRPPKQIWIGRPHERRIEVNVKTGEEAAERARGRRGGRGRRGRRQARRWGKHPAACTARRSTSRRSTSPTSTSAPAACRCPSRWSAARRSRGPQHAAASTSTSTTSRCPAAQAPPAVTGPLLPDPGRLPPEAVAALVGGDRHPAARRCSRCCSSSSCPRTSRCPTSSASRRRSRPSKPLTEAGLRLAAADQGEGRPRSRRRARS